MKKIHIISILLLISICYFLNKAPRSNIGTENQPEVKQQPTTQTDKYEKASWNESKEFPTLNLPLKYFSAKDISWGSAGGKGKEGTMEEFTLVALDSKTVYQSYPTTDILIKKYSNEIVSINPGSYIEVKNKVAEYTDPDSVWMTEGFEENYKTYGKLGLYFLFKGLHIEGDTSLDIDGDGIKERIITTNGFGRASGGSTSVSIVKGDKVIFSVNEDNSTLIAADTSNGFYVQWRDPDDYSPRCCEVGYMRTRFVYDNGEFTPLYEQEIRYFMVGKKVDLK